MELVEKIAKAKEKGLIALAIFFVLELIQNRNFKQVMILISVLIFAVIVIFMFRFEFGLNPFRFKIEKEIMKIETLKSLTNKK